MSELIVYKKRVHHPPLSLSHTHIGMKQTTLARNQGDKFFAGFRKRNVRSPFSLRHSVKKNLV
jgi:hypothetical protein